MERKRETANEREHLRRFVPHLRASTRAICLLHRAGPPLAQGHLTWAVPAALIALLRRYRSKAGLPSTKRGSASAQDVDVDALGESLSRGRDLVENVVFD